MSDDPRNATLPGLIGRVAALERRVLELTAEWDFSENDMPWREPLVQRVATEIDNPTARQIDIKGRFFRDGMQHMIIWLRQNPEAWKERLAGSGTRPRRMAACAESVRPHRGVVRAAWLRILRWLDAEGARGREGGGVKVYVLMELLPRTQAVSDDRILGVFGSFRAAAIRIMGFDPDPDVEIADGGPWQFGEHRIEEHEVQE